MLNKLDILLPSPSYQLEPDTPRSKQHLRVASRQYLRLSLDRLPFFLCSTRQDCDLHCAIWMPDVRLHDHVISSSSSENEVDTHNRYRALKQPSCCKQCSLSSKDEFEHIGGCLAIAKRASRLDCNVREHIQRAAMGSSRCRCHWHHAVYVSLPYILLRLSGSWSLAQIRAYNTW